MVTVDMGYVALYAGLFAIFLWWLIDVVKDNSFQNGYWKGRAVGWDMHRRMINIKRDTDEVFDYDKD